MKTTLVLSILGILLSISLFSQNLERLTFKLVKEDIASIGEDTLMLEEDMDMYENLIWDGGDWSGERERIEYLQIDISNQNLKNLPRELRKSPWISRLEMSDNELTKISRRFSKLRVDTLLLSRNKIEGLKNYWFRPMNLLFNSVSYLDLSNNLFESIPSISFQRTKHLDLSFNKIQLISLCNVSPMLEELYVSNNEISTFYFKTTKYNSLRILKLNNNLLEECPKSIYRLKNLEELDLSNNQIKKISMRIRRLTNLKKLELSGNNLSEAMLEKISKQLPVGCEFVY